MCSAVPNVYADPSCVVSYPFEPCAIIQVIPKKPRWLTKGLSLILLRVDHLSIAWSSIEAFWESAHSPLHNKLEATERGFCLYGCRLPIEREQ